MKTLKHFFQTVDAQTIIVTTLAVISTWVCRRYTLLADVPTNLIGLAVVFPIVFSINAAYKRREEALSCLSSIKAGVMGMYWAHRDWVSGGTADPAHIARFQSTTESFIDAINEDLTPKGRSTESQAKVYASFSKFSASHEALRKSGVAATEVSRLNQYLSKMITDYERMRNIAQIRTPEALQAYSSVFLNLFPIAFGPYFAFLCDESKTFPAVGYIVAVLYSLVLVTLDNLEEHLEDPFDGKGIDDVHLPVFEDYRSLMTAE